MVTINNTSIRQNVFETVYDRLKAKADGSDFDTSTQPTITAAYIDDDQSFPQIVIHPVDVTKDTYNLQQSNPNRDIVVI